MNNNPYTRPYMNYQNNYNQQNMYEQIDNQIHQLTTMKEQLKNNSIQNQQQPSINQTFQLAPNNNTGLKYVNSIEDVNKENVFVDTAFFSNNLSVVWIKNAKGEIKTYELKEIEPLDEKDIQIQYLQSQIEELKGMINNERTTSNVSKSEVSEDTTTNDESIGEPVEKSKSTSISRVSKSKEK